MSEDDGRVALRIFHIREEIAFLRQLLEGTTAMRAVENPLHRRAIERSLQILSEAVRHLPLSMTERFPMIEWRAIRDMGNRLRHDYDRLDRNILIEVLDFELDAVDHACEQLQITLPPRV